MNRLPLTPAPYAINAIKWLITHANAGLFLPPGLGKTAITLYAFKQLKEAGIIDTLIVVAPIRVATIVWPSEVAKWEDFRALSIGVLHGNDKLKTLNTAHDIYTINPEGLSWFIKVTKGRIPSKTMLVCDESTWFKNHSSERFKMLKKLAPKFEKRVILTGTPAPNGLTQLWPQIFLLDLGKRLSPFITQFRNTYFYPSGFRGYEFKLIQGSEEKIYAAINDIVMHKSSDEIDLPPIMYNTINVRLPTSARIVYEDMKKYSVHELDDQNVIVANNAAILGGKLKQIANGGLYTEGKAYTTIHDEKVCVIESLMNELSGRPLLVIYEFNHDLDRLKTVFQAPHIGGGVSSKDAASTIDKWNKGELPLMFLHPQSGGHGLNLQDGGCHDVVWFSIPFDLELYEQANKRVHRQGVKNSVTIHHIVAEKTIDEYIMKVLDKKDILQSALLEAVKK